MLAVKLGFSVPENPDTTIFLVLKYNIPEIESLP